MSLFRETLSSLFGPNETVVSAKEYTMLYQRLLKELESKIKLIEERDRYKAAYEMLRDMIRDIDVDKI